ENLDVVMSKRGLCGPVRRATLGNHIRALGLRRVGTWIDVPMLTELAQYSATVDGTTFRHRLPSVMMVRNHAPPLVTVGRHSVVRLPFSIFQQRGPRRSSLVLGVSGGALRL